MITVFGSINLDIAIDVKNFPLAGETTHVNMPQYSPGGKGANQALSAQNSGSPTTFIGAVGDDAHAATALHNLSRAGVDLTALQKQAIETNTAYIIRENTTGENKIFVTQAANTRILASSVPQSIIEAMSFLVLQLETPIDQSIEISQRVKASGGQIILNAAPMDDRVTTLLPHIDWLIVNEIELEQIVTLMQIAKDSPKAMAQNLRAQTGLNLVVTLGGEGALLILDQTVHAPAESITPIDTTGAGDAFVGAFAAALDQGKSPAQALAFAVHQGAQACLHKGAQPSLA